MVKIERKNVMWDDPIGFIVVGVILCSFGVTAIIGIPLIILGVYCMIKQK